MVLSLLPLLCNHDNLTLKLHKKNSYQASAYETCGPTHTPLHTSETSETCKKKKKKKAGVVWLKKLQGVRKIPRLKQRFSYFTSYKTQILRENYVYLFIIALVQWWKLYYIYIFLRQRTTDFNRLKWNMNDGTIFFFDVFTYCLNVKKFTSFFFLIQDNFMHRCSGKNVLTIIFEITKKENNTNTSSFNTFNRCWFKKPLLIFFCDDAFHCIITNSGIKIVLLT